MSVTDVLHPDGTDYDPFLYAEVGQDRTGSNVTVLSALARLGLEPWTEARKLARMGQDAAQVRLKAHLAAIRDVPTLGLASGSMATQLVSLLPNRSASRGANLPAALAFGAARLPVIWVLMALVGLLIVARVFVLAQAG